MNKWVEFPQLYAPVRVLRSGIERIDATVDKERFVIVMESGREFAVQWDRGYDDLCRYTWGDKNG
jgi:hypothetical protein